MGKEYSKDASQTWMYMGSPNRFIKFMTLVFTKDNKSSFLEEEQNTGLWKIPLGSLINKKGSKLNSVWGWVWMCDENIKITICTFKEYNLLLITIVTMFSIP